MRFKSVNALVTKTTGKTFQAYWNEMRRHEKALRKIYANDRNHICTPEVIGSIRRVGSRTNIVELKRCAVCMKDMP